MLTVSEKIKLLAKRRKIRIADIAAATNQSRQNLTRKLSENSIVCSELEEIASVLNQNVLITFIDKDTKEEL